jgi:hypothetical protein
MEAEESREEKIKNIVHSLEMQLSELNELCDSESRSFYNCLSILSEYNVMGIIVGECRIARKGEKSLHIEKIYSSEGELVSESRRVPIPTIYPLKQAHDMCSDCLKKASLEGKFDIVPST